MMDAKLVWHTWRKILRDEMLQQRVFDPAWSGANDTSLSPAEQDVIAAYADSRDRAKWFIENYQFRLVNSFINALETGAPLTLRALLNSGFEMAELSHRFLRQHHWHDYGPRVYQYGSEALDWLIEKQHLLGLSAALVDLIWLEKTTVTLYLSLQNRPGLVTAGRAEYQQSGMARLYRSRYQLTNWLRDKKSLGLQEPAIGEENLLVVLPDYSSRHKYLRIPDRCAALFNAPSLANVQPEHQDELHLARLLACNALVSGEAR